MRRKPRKPSKVLRKRRLAHPNKLIEAYNKLLIDLKKARALHRRRNSRGGD
ncbi:hypothetical protein PPTG_21082, partial [Phytophthora nicotianae INRA-310]